MPDDPDAEARLASLEARVAALEAALGEQAEPEEPPGRAGEISYRGQVRSADGVGPVSWSIGYDAAPRSPCPRARSPRSSPRSATPSAWPSCDAC